MNIHFEVQIKSGLRSDNRGSVKSPKRFPCFVLNHNDDWNDYGYYTWFSLFFFKSNDDCSFLGELKIIHNNDLEIIKCLDKEFHSLSNDFCSLGISADYYRKLKSTFSVNECKLILSALQDCALSIESYERNKEVSAFNISLMRDLSSERAWREGKYIINGMSVNNAYDINYVFHPEYNKDINVPFKFKFDYNAIYYNRCACVIGENGVGKTTLLSKLITDLINGEKNNFKSELPLFSCVMAICTTPYDSFSKVKHNNKPISFLPYYYYCAGQQVGTTEKILEDSIYDINKRMVKNKSVFKQYEIIVRAFFKKLEINRLWGEIENNDKKKFVVYSEGINKIIPILSSGELQLLLLITFIFRKINFDSLLVIDEPEVHLHPKAIKDLFGLLSKMLSVFQSYCIVSTHSPLIVRELPGKKVLLMRRFKDDTAEIGKIQIETLGEDISILYDKIFGYDDLNTNLAKIVKKMIESGTTQYKDIIRKLKSEDKPLSLNTKFIVKQITDNEKY